MARDNTKKASGGASAFVLMIGDEGAILVQMHKKKVVRRLFAQSPEPMHNKALDEALNASPKAPITILVDIMDQSYVRQTLPPVSSFSVGKIVKRRLEKDFSAEDITGYLILDREKTGRKDWNYIMTSLANPPLLQKWIAFVVERPNPFRGMGLIPLEAQPFITACEKAILLKERGKGGDLTLSEWQILVNHHKVGGFRQVVLRKGKLIFTRMAQPIGESLPEVIAGNIEQEMTNTIEYLKRLGLQGPDFISVIIVAAEDIKKVLDAKSIKAGSYHFFTPYELAELLNIKDSAQPEDQFGDVVISSFIGKRRKLLLSLTTTYIRKLLNFSRVILATRMVAALAILTVLGWAGTNAFDIYTTKDDIDKLGSTQNTLHAQLNATKERTQTLPKNINLFTDLQTLAHVFDKRRYDPLTFLSNFSDSLDEAALVNSYQWTLGTPLDVTKDTDKRQIKAELQLRLTAPLEPHNAFIAQAEGLMTRISKRLSDFDVSHAALPGVLPENQDLKTVIDDTTNSSVPAVAALTDNTVKVTITGPIAKTTTPPKH